MNEKILEITKNKDYLTELLSKDTLEEIVEFCKSKGVEINIDDAKEFVELIQLLRSEAEKCKANKEKLNDDELVDKVVGGYHVEVDHRNWGGDQYHEVYDTLDEKIKYEEFNADTESRKRKDTAKTVVASILGTIGGIVGIGVATYGAVSYIDKKKKLV